MSKRTYLAAIALAVASLLFTSTANAAGCLLCDPQPPTEGGTVTPPSPAPLPAEQPVESVDPVWRAMSPLVDHRPCVSSREFHSVKRWTKSEVETRWEVVGLGKQRVLIGVGPAMVYPRCAYKPSEALYAIAYLNGRVHVAVEFKEVGAQPHGRP